MENKELLNKIKVYSAMKNISQEELAIAIGVTRKTINTVETGKFIPSTVLALRIARYFGVPVEEIFVLNDEAFTYNISQIAMICPMLPPKQNRWNVACIYGLRSE